MKIFISHRRIDEKEVDSLLKNISGYEFIFHRKLESTDAEWQEEVKLKMEQSNFVLFFLGKTSHESEPINWEYNLAKKLNKNCFIIRLPNCIVPKYVKNEFIIDCQVDKIKEKLDNQKLLTQDSILVEQYKIMVSSTEKVTERRSGVNNLFFTVTTSLLSIAALVGKLIGFENKHTSMLATGVMLFFTLVAFVITFFWQKLVTSYGKLNKGKFLVISEIEERLNTNLFQREWEILQNKEIGYKSNTKTETSIIWWFRIFIIIIGLIEIIYLINLQYNLI